jgi:catechol 2,3-dioxygenase-like lactoylglutathione lyase family enzyme
VLEAFGLRFHHLGLAVPGPDEAFRFLAGLGYAAGAQIFDPLQGVHLAMRHHLSMPDVEVIWPGEGPSPIDGMIKRGNMIYHLGFVAADAAAALGAMESNGFRVFALGEPKPARLFGGTPVSFHRVDGFGLIELLHGEPRAPVPE